MVTSANDILEEYNQKLKLNFKTNISTKNPIEKEILDILDEKGELTADEIIRETGLELSQTLAVISMLEIKGRIKKGGGKYILI